MCFTLQENVLKWRRYHLECTHTYFPYFVHCTHIRPGKENFNMKGGSYRVCILNSSSGVTLPLSFTCLLFRRTILALSNNYFSWIRIQFAFGLESTTYGFVLAFFFRDFVLTACIDCRNDVKQYDTDITFLLYCNPLYKSRHQVLCIKLFTLLCA